MLSYEERQKEWEQDKSYLFFALNLIFIVWCFNSYYSLIFLIPLVLYIHLFKIKGEVILWATLIGTALAYLQPLKCPNTYFNYLFDFHKPLNNFLRKYYSERDASFIALLLFNSGKKESDTYESFKELGIAHLICISGLHFVLIKKVLYYLLFKKEKASKIVTPIVLIIWWCFTNFSIPCLRVILTTFLNTKSKLKNWSLATILVPLFNFGIYTNYSFLLSFIITLLLMLVEGKHKAQKCFILIFIYSSLITLPWTNKLYLLSFINLIIFSPIVTLFFIYFFLTFPLLFLATLNSKLIDLFYFLLKHSYLNKASLNISWSYEASTIALLLFTTAIVINLRRNK
ncbi:hypothetical protein A6V39_04850 [Candidatus Mycoplasma haematobovis]|uniref:ComEC/Rec2-related protein domain-containing protein n=1 Tax=Candidatus Mycoplasma haematobovis TaxID=432608 RepID=A0A1A9QCQ3_9MOLU|nr:ComEC/Rec2 family competence protein [Candidatus Mycoplasma haematobovis]OAL09874.1 hypothetical protein A6V39_04850 [Candidatus Mycoplasma haematobovis]